MKTGNEAENERLAEYSCTVGHDSRNPLSVVQGRLVIDQEAVDWKPLGVIDGDTLS